MAKWGKRGFVKCVDLSSKASSATYKLGGPEQTPQSLALQFPHLQNEIIMPSLKVSCKTGDINNKEKIIQRQLEGSSCTRMGAKSSTKDYVI